MLEVVSQLSYLKLVSPNKPTPLTPPATKNGTDNTNGNGKVMKPTTKTGEVDNHQAHEKQLGVHTMTNGGDGSKNVNISPLSSNGTCSTTATSCNPYIFEKVDYIKKINIRRKAFKRLKKARSKTRVISPATATESRKIKL